MADAVLLASARLADRAGILPGVSDAPRVFGCPGLPLRARPLLGMRLHSNGRAARLSRVVAEPEFGPQETCLDGLPLAWGRDAPGYPYGQLAATVPRPDIPLGLLTSTWNQDSPTAPSRRESVKPYVPKLV